jgi:hypothetical protein
MPSRKIQSPEEALAEFLTEAPKDVLTGRGGAPCQTCRHPQRKLIEEACRLFNEKRRSGETSASWNSFLKHVLKPKFGYGLDIRSLRRHLENCLEWQIV